MLRQRLPCTFILAALMLCLLSFAAYAHPVPDLSQKGSIKITMHYGEKAVSGGTMTLYHVGAVREQDGNYDFVLTGDFTDCGIALEAIQSAELAGKLADYAAQKKLPGVTQKIGTDGTVVFSELELGLYLMVQQQAAHGYKKASPFLVSVPMLENEGYVYDVEAGPKAELTPTSPDEPDEPDEPDKPDNPSEPSNPDNPDEPDKPDNPSKPGNPNNPDEPGNPDNPGEPENPNNPGGPDSPGGPRENPQPELPRDTIVLLPQTGQLNWPVPVLAVLGLGTFSLGWKLRYGKGQEDET